MVILAFLVPIFVAGAIGAYRKYVFVAMELRRQEGRLRELGEEVSRLRSAIEYFSHDVNIEKEARLRFNVSRPGEIAVILVSPQPPPSPSPTEPPPESFFQRLFKRMRLRSSDRGGAPNDFLAMSHRERAGFV